MRNLPPLTMLRVFEEVAHHRSFNRAADALNVTQGAVSRQIKQLEEYLGISLFLRTPRGLTLTEAGSALAPHLGEAFDQMERALQAVRVPNLRQRLRILAPPTWGTRWLSPRLRDFLRRYPDISLSVTNHLETENAGELDCRIRFGLQQATQCHSELLVMERHIAVASPELFDDGQPPELNAFPLLHILHEGKRLRVWENWLAAMDRTDVDASSGIEFSTLDQVIHTALAGGGLAVIDRQMIERELAAGSLLPITPVEVIGPYGYWLDIATEKKGLSKVQRFQDWLGLVSNP
ncbi:LysR substrate-binding domain-containing protein [Pseudomonas sp. GD04087]|uniref:LysR substrate-binding domain-containing protein n=1 Tax=Pseudomonas TaxID=286 RepID=UPI001F3FA9DC|nr:MULTISPECIES: LysR substrate-binding domain-containing protein [Pseudomonas]MCP1646721.1 DNA-binding transcriptional LysR family regulator [Pseudomonas nitroreducens]MCP1685297.1 DNA-binding transcriptional LysR family regulator [Pseudomonas nitroreducens]MDH0289246.1 LysR substrate-binding domain-containing protein [Pseudomonas sp. GD04087]MDH1047903.1 LysR substrate-binding domain-containing protein [Pseudomonas sp. GD03903]MDH1998586.1 LysR substrate-binding domain-containing protein [Ps